MTSERIWRGEQALPACPRNLAEMLNANVAEFADRPLFQHVVNGSYAALTWREFQADISRIQAALVAHGLHRNDRVAILSPNRKEMLEMELSIMSMGAVAVPIFAGYPATAAKTLVDFCEPSMIVVADTEQYLKLGAPEKFQRVIHFDQLTCPIGSNCVALATLVSQSSASQAIAGSEVEPDSVCLMMYTSGTMGRPKLVQLRHSNILSQQAAMRGLWKLDQNDRFLSYLPWHHSFGGIYEKYAALYNGAVLSLEHGYGKQIDLLLENWKRVRPTVFFSVPRIYQQIATQVLQNPELGRVIFHDELRFVFTAAAPLKKSLSEMYEERGIPVYEGWGLTETSPCCTTTDPSVPRAPGVVGKPIAGVSIRIAADGEILVQGPNVMLGYFKDAEATERVLSPDGWFATGDVGEFTETGLRLISRKDRIFKLSNAEKMIPTEVENLIVDDCCFLSHAFVTGNGRDYPVVLLFPNKAMFEQKPDPSRLKPGCDCPSGPKDLAYCLTNCMKKLNEKIDPKFARPQAAMLLDHELSIENEELTPSMKLAPNVVGQIFKARIERLYGEGEVDDAEDVYILNLEQ